MKAINFKKNSWHAWIVRGPGCLYQLDWLAENGKIDICRYTRSFIRGVILGILFLAFILMVAALLIIPNISFGMYLYASYQAGHFLPWTTNETALVRIAIIVDSVTFLIAMIAYVIPKTISKIRSLIGQKERVVKEPGFVKVAYRSFKDKVCFKVNLQ